MANGNGNGNGNGRKMRELAEKMVANGMQAVILTAEMKRKMVGMLVVFSGGGKTFIANAGISTVFKDYMILSNEEFRSKCRPGDNYYTNPKFLPDGSIDIR